MNETSEADRDLRAALTDLASELERRRTPTGRKPYQTRLQGGARRQVRIANRFVPRHSLAITLDTELSSSARLCLTFILSLPRRAEGPWVDHVSHGAIAAHFGVTTRTAQKWMGALEEAGYLHRLPVRRGVFHILLSTKATRWKRLGRGDLATIEAAKSRRTGPMENVEKCSTPETCDRIANFRTAYKERDLSSLGLPPLDPVSQQARIAARFIAERVARVEAAERRRRADALRR